MKERIEVLLSAEQIDKRMAELADELYQEFGDEQVELVCALKGAVVTIVDLAKKMKMPVTMNFMSVSSYGNSMESSGNINIKMDLDADITGPSIPKTFGVHNVRIYGDDNGMIPPATTTGIDMISVNLLLGEDKTIETNLPAQGVVTLMDQTAEHRLVNHLLYASPVKRGNGIEVIEDIIPLTDITVKLRTDKTPKRVYLAPEKRDIPFTYENGVLAYTVDKLNCHAIAVIDY